MKFIVVGPNEGKLFDKHSNNMNNLVRLKRKLKEKREERFIIKTTTTKTNQSAAKE